MPSILPPLIATVVVPLALVLWMASPRLGSRLEALLLAIASGAYVLFALAAGPIWGWVGMVWRWSLVALWLLGFLAMTGRWKARPWRPKGGLLAWLGIAGEALFALVAVSLLAQVVAGYRAPATSVVLEFPLAPGRYLVLNGGGSPALNAHSGVPAQSLALDIVGLGDDGRRADGLQPTALEDYDIYGTPVIAPCAGEVIGARDDAANATIGVPDPEQPAGNYVTLVCEPSGEPVTVLMAHFQPGSLEAEVGGRVEAGAQLALVGNSGNSSEPHLHIHAVAGRVADHETLITDATPVGIRFGDRLLRRNDVVER